MTKIIAIFVCALLLAGCAQQTENTTETTSSEIISSAQNEETTIRSYIEYAKENHDADMDYELIFLNMDADDETEMIMTASYSSTHCISSLYDADNNEVYEKTRDFNYGTTDYLMLAKCRGKNGQEFFINLDRDRIGYVPVDNTDGIQNLFSDAYFDKGSPETAVKIYEVSDYVSECTGNSFEHITLEGVTAENLVTEDVYNEMFEAFKQSVEFIPTDVKRVEITSEQLDTLSAGEIYNMLADSALEMDFIDFEEPSVWLKGVLEKAISETTTDLNGNPTSAILAYGDINCDGENEFFIGNWNVSTTSSLCKFSAYISDGYQFVDNEFYSMDNTPFSAVYHDAENDTYTAESSYFLKDTDGAEIQRVQRLVYNDKKWYVETEDIDPSAVPTQRGEQLDTAFSVIKISDSGDIVKAIDGLNEGVAPQLPTDDTADALIFTENETPCAPDEVLQMDFETASTLLHDVLEADGEFPEDAKMLDDGAVEINGTIYHRLSVCSDNGENISRMGTFYVSDFDGTVYICFDPTLDTLGIFADYAGEIDENDYRTRLIKITATTETAVGATIPSDEEIIEMFNYAEDLQMQTMMFYNDGNGNFLSEEGKTPAQYREEFSQTFTERFTDEFFELYGSEYSYGSSKNTDVNAFWFRFYEDSVNYFVEQYGDSFEDYKKLDLSDFSAYSEYDAVFIGGIVRGDDISIVDHELRITEKSADKITLTMTVWHCNPPDYKLIANEDYFYHLENGKLVYDAKFCGLDDEGEPIVMKDELAGTIAEDITGTSEPNYLVNYEYNMVLEDGLWKFDSYPEWY